MAPSRHSRFQELCQATQFELHPLQDIIPFECHPNFSSITRETNKQSMKSLGITDSASQRQFVQSRVGMLASLVIPRGEDDQKMILASKNLVALFALDDVLEKSDPQHARTLVEALVTAAHNPPPDDDEHFQTFPRPWLFFHKVTQQIRYEMTPSMFSRYFSMYTAYLLGVLDEVENHEAKNHIPDVETYRNFRRKIAFVDGSIFLVSEFCMGIELEREIFESPEYVNLYNAISKHAELVNDLLSFRKEFFSGSHCNWVCVLMNQGKSLQQAIDAIYKMICEVEDNMLKLQKEVIKIAHATKNMGLLKIANTCLLIASGNAHWSFITGRYHGYNNPLISGEPFHGTCLLHPDATIVLQLKNCQYTHPLLVE